MFLRLVVALILVSAAGVGQAEARSCVWKVTSPSTGTLYLGGSVHSLRAIDYPLPWPYKVAFDASTDLAFEVSPQDLHGSGKALERVGTYPTGDSLKNHVSPATWNFLLTVFGYSHVPESKFSKYRPWYLSLALNSSQVGGMSKKLGVESHFARQAQEASKPITGLETLSEHAEVFSGLSNSSSEALLLLSFDSADKNLFVPLMKAWRKGDPEYLANSVRYHFRNLPSMADRLLSDRNRKWIPKIEDYMRSGKTYFVVVGAAHMGGKEGVLALLKARGYRIEQL